MLPARPSRVTGTPRQPFDMVSFGHQGPEASMKHVTVARPAAAGHQRPLGAKPIGCQTCSWPGEEFIGESPVTSERGGQQAEGAEVCESPQAQFGEHSGLHLLRLIDQQHLPGRVTEADRSSRVSGFPRDGMSI